MTQTAFCDWLSVSQQHDPASVPDFVDGRVVKVSGGSSVVFADEGVALVGDGLEVDYCTGTYHQARGSFETSLRVRCVGGRVEVQGNPSAWGRLDNVLGVSVDEGMAVFNEVLNSLLLPPFTPGVLEGHYQSRGDVSQRICSGAQISRADMTFNLAVGLGRVKDFNRWAASQKLYRSCPAGDAGQYGFETVYLSDSVQWMAVKAYDKSLAVERLSGREFEKRLRAGVKAGRLSADDASSLLADGSVYLSGLAAWLAEVGCVRYELRLGRKFLDENGYRLWVPGVTGRSLCEVAAVELDRLMARAVVVAGDVEELLTPGELAVYRAWRRGRVGQECAASRASYYRLRGSIMKKTGLDVGRPCGDVVDAARPSYFRVKALSASSFPSWYRMPETSRLAA
jgi:hypothetical protein